MPERFRQYKLKRADLPVTPELMRHYPDPMAAAPEGTEYRRRWLARMEPVKLRGQDTGWLVIVQEAYDTAIGAPLGRLETDLIHYGLAALGIVAVVVLGLWGFTIRLLKDDRGADRPPVPPPPSWPPDRRAYARRDRKREERRINLRVGWDKLSQQGLLFSQPSPRAAPGIAPTAAAVGARRGDRGSTWRVLFASLSHLRLHFPPWAAVPA